MDEQFKPDYSPYQVLNLGAFGGTYFRPITDMNGSELVDDYKKYKMLRNISRSKLVLPYSEYDPSINKYGVKVGTTLEYWRQKKWIQKSFPDQRGWFQWYLEYYNGRRIPELENGFKYDEYQIKRWIGVRNRFIGMLKKLEREGKDTRKVRQNLLEWAIDYSKTE